MKKALILILTGAALCACQKSKDPAPAPTKQPTPATTATLSLTPDLVTTPEPTPTLAPTPEPTLTPEPTRAPIPTGMPERKVKEYDASVDTIPISEEYFSDAEFRKIISELVDTNKDGMLSREEREAVTMLGDTGAQNGMRFDASSYVEHWIDGLEWFPNMKKIRISGPFLGTIALYHHPGITQIRCGGTWDDLNVYADGCPNLEEIEVVEGYYVNAVILNCEKMRDFSLVETLLTSLYCENTPNLQLTHLTRKYCSLGTEAGVYPGWSWNDYAQGSIFEVKEDGSPEFPIEWRGIEKLGLDLAGLKTKMTLHNESFIDAEQLSYGDAKTIVRCIFFSPAKASVFCVDSHTVDAEGNYKNGPVHYYITNGADGIIAYDSLEELYKAASQMEDLKNVNLKETVEAIRER